MGEHNDVATRPSAVRKVADNMITKSKLVCVFLLPFGMASSLLIYRIGIMRHSLHYSMLLHCIATLNCDDMDWICRAFFTPNEIATCCDSLCLLATRNRQDEKVVKI